MIKTIYQTWLFGLGLKEDMIKIRVLVVYEEVFGNEGGAFDYRAP